MGGVHDAGHAGQAADDPAVDAGLGVVGVEHVGPLAAAGSRHSCPGGPEVARAGSSTRVEPAELDEAHAPGLEEGDVGARRR